MNDKEIASHRDKTNAIMRKIMAVNLLPEAVAAAPFSSMEGMIVIDPILNASILEKKTRLKNLCAIYWSAFSPESKYKKHRRWHLTIMASHEFDPSITIPFFKLVHARLTYIANLVKNRTDPLGIIAYRNYSEGIIYLEDKYIYHATIHENYKDIEGILSLLELIAKDDLRIAKHGKKVSYDIYTPLLLINKWMEDSGIPFID